MLDPEWLRRARSLSGSSDFKEAHVYVDPSPDGSWRVSVVAMPISVPLTSDTYPDRKLALARAEDFERLIRNLQVTVRRRYTGRSKEFNAG